MRPLNGKCAMTREERNARRRELDAASAFHRANTRKTANKWRKKHAEAIKARRREKYATDPAYRQKQRKYSLRWRKNNPDKVKLSWKKWADKNREHLRERDRLRSATQAESERRKRLVAERRERIASDPDYTARIRAAKREHYHRFKHTQKGIAWLQRYIWEPKWREVCAAGAARIQSYVSRAKPRTREYFARWFGANRRALGLADIKLNSRFEIVHDFGI